jgi:hypothetical protein
MLSEPEQCCPNDSHICHAFPKENCIAILYMEFQFSSHIIIMDVLIFCHKMFCN